jgi:hypothetical protein
MLAPISTVLVINECLILLFDTVSVTGVYKSELCEATYSTQCTQLATRLSTSQQLQQDRKP